MNQLRQIRESGYPCAFLRKEGVGIQIDAHYVGLLDLSDLGDPLLASLTGTSSIKLMSWLAGNACLRRKAENITAVEP